MGQVNKSGVRAAIWRTWPDFKWANLSALFTTKSYKSSSHISHIYLTKWRRWPQSPLGAAWNKVIFYSWAKSKSTLLGPKEMCEAISPIAVQLGQLYAEPAKRVPDYLLLCTTHNNWPQTYHWLCEKEEHNSNKTKRVFEKLFNTSAELPHLQMLIPKITITWYNSNSFSTLLV